MYAGTRYGDIIEVICQQGRYKGIGPVKRIFQGGVNCLNANFGALIVGAADGSIAKVDKKTFTLIEELNLR